MPDEYNAENFTLRMDSTPQQFRFRVTPKAAMRLVRNCETCRLYSPWLGMAVKVQKGDILEALKFVDTGQSVIFCTFDGMNLLVVAMEETQSEKGSEE